MTFVIEMKQFENIHLGEVIKKILKDRGITYASVARAMNTSRQNFQQILKKPDLDTRHMKKLSEILDFNLFTLFVREDDLEYVNEESPVYGLAMAREKLEECRKEVKRLKEKNKDLAEIKKLQEELLREKGKKK